MSKFGGSGLSFKFHVLPTGGGYDPTLLSNGSPGFIFSVLKYGTLPGLTVAITSFAGYTFTMRNQMALGVSEDYVLLAKAKGLSPRRIMTTYAGRNAILPSVAQLATTLGGSLGGVLVIEVVFTYPGLGSLMVSGIAASDFPLIQAVFLVITIAVLIMNFLADSIYVFIDPRTREAAK